MRPHVGRGPWDERLLLKRFERLRDGEWDSGVDVVRRLGNKVSMANKDTTFVLT